MDELLQLAAALLEDFRLALQLGLDRLLAGVAQERALAALLDGLELGDHAFHFLAALVDGGLGGVLGLLDFALDGDGLTVLLHDLFGIDNAHVRGSGAQGDGGKGKG